MRSPIAPLLALFAGGATIMQTCTRLPPVPGLLLAAALCVAGGSLHVAARNLRELDASPPDASSSIATTPRPAIGVRLLTLAVALVGTGLAGFFYAAWRAETRLADELPDAWEARDIRVVG